MRLLVVNADDFGFTRDVNAGIVEAHHQGILSSTTLMAPGAAFDDAVRLAKEAINKAYESTLAEGIGAERRNFYLLFSTEDQKEGMTAFVDKRDPQWKGQ